MAIDMSMTSVVDIDFDATGLKSGVLSSVVKFIVAGIG
jgi:hypothetical protein